MCHTSSSLFQIKTKLIYHVFLTIVHKYRMFYLTMYASTLGQFTLEDSLLCGKTPQFFTPIYKIYTARFMTSKLNMWQDLNVYSQCHFNVPTTLPPAQELSGSDCIGTLTPQVLCRNSRVHTQSHCRLLLESYHIIN